MQKWPMPLSKHHKRNGKVAKRPHRKYRRMVSEELGDFHHSREDRRRLRRLKEKVEMITPMETGDEDEHIEGPV